ncbi:MAG TPA: hypothetical protein VD713_06590, partial [Sphingomonadales bacterium]|nr:hypothetical protein [Sphingomonadales bacterium]
GMAKERKTADFEAALRAYFFFTRRSLIGFYLAMGFAVGFAVFISILTAALIALGTIPGGFASHGRFFAQMVVYFGIGLLILLAAVTIAFHLWQIVIRRSDIGGEFPEVIERMRVIRAFSDAGAGAGTKFFAFILPPVAAASLLVLPLFGGVAFLSEPLGFDGTGALRPMDLFIPVYFLVWVATFLVGLHYHLGSRRVGGN